MAYKGGYRVSTKSQLSEEQANEAIRLCEDERKSYSQVGAQFGVSRATISGIIYQARAQGVIPPSDPKIRIDKQSNKEIQTSRRLSQLQTHGSLGAPIKPLPKISVKQDEPEFIGPLNDFPPRGTCRYTKDDPGKGDWRMCGQAGHPWCEWHQENRIRNKGNAA